MKILNLTQHKATPDQIEAGVIDLSEQARERLLDALTFEDLPNSSDIQDRAEQIVDLAMKTGMTSVMIGGVSYFMPTLQCMLLQQGFKVVHAFSRRESVDVLAPDGSMRKTSVFRHGGFVKAV